MNKIKVISVLFLFMICVEAQDSSKNQNDGINPLHPSMAVVLIVLSIMFCITFLIVAYAKYCHRNEMYHPDEVVDPGRGLVRSRSRFSGIDRNVIESLPFFRFSSLKGSKEGLECSVCLSRFEDSETLRLLPKCRHAFHMNCIDKWLENHSSCPLCRYRFDVGDLKSLTFTNSFRYSSEEPNLEFFIQREENRQERSSRFNSLQKLTRGRKEEEPLINQKSDNFKHKIIVSDVIYKSRWSDVNSSDLMALNSEMLSVMSSKRFSETDSVSGRFTKELSGKEHILKIKEDMEKKRLYESKVGKSEASLDKTSCSSPTVEQVNLTASRLLYPAEKRSMSEITNLSRFSDELGGRRRMNIGSMGSDEKIRRLWFPIARRTIQWINGGGESSSKPVKHSVNV